MIGIPIIPRPQSVEFGDSSFTTSDFRLVLEGGIAEEEALFLIEEILGTRVRPSSSASLVIHEGVEDIRLPSKEAYSLEVLPKERRIDLHVSSSRALLYALETIRQLSSPNDGGLRIPEAKVLDWPLFQFRGVVEGFYYDPWSWNQRREVIRKLSLFKMNSYIYAPKHDPYHRERWRERYPEGWITEFGKLVSTCKRWHVDFFFALSPGLSVIYSSREDEELILRKFLEMAEIGANGFCLFLDDIPEKLAHSEDLERYSSLAEAQADLVNRILRRLREEVPGAKMMFCPTRYAGTDLGRYFEELCRLMDEEVLIMWTGPQVCSKRITVDDAKNLEKEAGDRLVIWDNYPVNDYARNRLNLGPLKGRDPRLYKLIRGVFSNPMNEPYASLLPLATFADYLWNPESYDPADSWNRALKLLYGNCSEPVAFLSRQLGSSILWPEEPEELRILRKLADNPEENEELSNYFSKLSSLKEKLEACGGKVLDLLEEASAYLTKLHLYGEAGLKLLRLSEERGERAFERWVEFLGLLISAEDIREAAGEVPHFDERGWRISGRRFLCEALLDASREIFRRKGWPSLLLLPYSTIRYQVDGCSPWHMIDGRLDTSYMTTRKVRSGDVVGVDLGDSLQINSVRIEGGREGQRESIRGVLQCSTDGNYWRDLAEVRTPVFEVRFSDLRARYLRVLSEATEKPVSISLFQVQTVPYSVKASKGSKTTPYCLIDGRLDTYFEIRRAEPGDWVLIDLGECKWVEGVLIFQDPTYFARDLRILGSDDGKRFKSFGRVRRIVQGVKISEELRYLKLEVLREQGLARIYQVQIT